jgi:hypothetical protein
MKAAFLFLLAPLLMAAQAPQGQPPGQAPSTGPAGLFPEQVGPPANYRGYARNECSTSDGPAVRLTVLQGVVPEGVPRTPPRPSIELVLYAPLDKIAGQQFTVAPKPASGVAVAISCPVVGACAPAEGGTVTLGARGDNGAVTGEFRAKWAIGAPRAGRFTADWREADNKCS